MAAEVINQNVESHPKLNKFLLYSGIVSLILLILFSFLGFTIAFFVGTLFLDFAYILSGAKYRLAPKYISFKQHEWAAAAAMMTGLTFLGYDLIFNLFPKI